MILVFLCAASQWRIVDIQLLASVGWKRGWQPLSCRFSQNVTTCLSKESIPAIPFWNSTPYQKFEVPESRSTFRQLCIKFWLHDAHPLVATVEKNLSHAQKQRVGSRSCGLQDLSQYSDCALSCSKWLLQTNEQLSRVSFLHQWVGSGAASLSAAHDCKMWGSPKRDL